MASPCEVLIDSDDGALAERLTHIAQREAQRIEQKFSRYRDDNIIHRINQSHGQPVEVDTETADLLDYAALCHDISDGMFDITSGVLRQVWRFDGSDRIPSRKAVKQILRYIGWHRIGWQRPHITVPEGMEIDLGGIGKEYAVDRVVRLIGEVSPVSVLVNFGGDLCASGPRRSGHGWVVGVEDPGNIQQRPGAARDPHSSEEFELVQGGIATSGDTRRFLLKDGIRYSHILDPRTGWPVPEAPHSVTVAAGTCTEAGILATLAMLHGADAEAFLREQGVRFWCQR
ncbi:MAG TPA: FAD:protein FMN transferase [Gammaproteobacteria bacterium]|nr:FAD:protein FMN transferase [Gammaproteobacteria bacterium]